MTSLEPRPTARVFEETTDSAEHPEPSPVEPGLTAGPYRLCYELASGGMATVFLGAAEGPHRVRRLAAIKRIHPHLAKRRSFVEMFLDEARIASMIQHPNVCMVLDFGGQGRDYYLAMEYLVGEPLHRVSKRAAEQPGLDRSRWITMVCRCVSEAAQGLHAAHTLRDEAGVALNVVHRDVSPQNLFLTYDGTTKVVDFGIAHAENRTYETRTGTLKGKFAYMAPEQIEGAAVDRRADVWALGVVLWELITLRRLFKRANELMTMKAVQERIIHSPTALVKSAHPELDRIVLKALERDVDRRYATAEEMSDDLEDLLRVLPRGGRRDTQALLKELFPGNERNKRDLAKKTLSLAVGDLEPRDLLHEQSTHIAEAKPRAKGAHVALEPKPADSSEPLPKLAPTRRWIWTLGLTTSLAATFGLGIWMGQPREPDEAIELDAPATAADPPRDSPSVAPATPGPTAAPAPEPRSVQSEPDPPAARPSPAVSATGGTETETAEPRTSPSPEEDSLRATPTNTEREPVATATTVLLRVRRAPWALVRVGSRAPVEVLGSRRMAATVGPTTIRYQVMGRGPWRTRRVEVAPGGTTVVTLRGPT